MKITLTSILVDDQQKALEFYTEKLRFVKKMDIPMGDARWLTVVSPSDPNGPQLVLEPDWNPTLQGAAQNFKKTLVEKGIPYTAFAVENIAGEYERLKGMGVIFTKTPTASGPTTVAIFDDTCGNLIQMYELQTV